MHEYTELSEAAVAAENVGIPLHTVDCTDSFNRIIRKNFVEEYLAGRTPNPCILCNEKVKFKYLFDYAMSHGFDAIATGHYARVREILDGDEKRYAVARSADSKKDQTYMLYRLPQEILARLILPLSDITKSDVRSAARDSGIFAADRADSQEICFLPEGDHAGYIETVAGKCPEGNFVDADGRILGKHRGIIRYTVGQRKGLGISLGERAFVTAIDPISNTVTLAPAMNGVTRVNVNDMVYSGMRCPRERISLEMSVKLRYSSADVKCMAHLSPDNTCTLEFDSPVKAAPGQSAVLYLDGTVMCGGFIR
jgi:tRNA-specific 2-thiouridylase